ncbi:hypothetical protein [Pseudomonas plecoglossicida]|uniref:hypothetical protein n=1 Tax=Pseudomonas plecoglossicida TaxID=70775 RepID=UPI00048F904D|nr:hypothetical protein [Pseudomonas plecoglossicida]GLR34715.1 hypothetical protein GCM10011247_01120 [Pseudomonas plecoglossicida]
MSTKSVTIQGVPPVWEDSEYQRRLTLELHRYRNTRDCMEFIHTALEYDFLNLLIEKHGQGYRLNKHYPASHEQLSHAIWLTKPDDQQQADIEQVKEKVKCEYVEHLRVQHDKYKEHLRKQLLQAQEEKERKAVEQAQAKRLAAIDKEVSECFGELVVPDGIPEQKPAEATPAEFSLAFA